MCEAAGMQLEDEYFLPAGQRDKLAIGERMRRAPTTTFKFAANIILTVKRYSISQQLSYYNNNFTIC